MGNVSLCNERHANSSLHDHSPLLVVPEIEIRSHSLENEHDSGPVQRGCDKVPITSPIPFSFENSTWTDEDLSRFEHLLESHPKRRKISLEIPSDGETTTAPLSTGNDVTEVPGQTVPICLSTPGSRVSGEQTNEEKRSFQLPHKLRLKKISASNKLLLPGASKNNLPTGKNGEKDIFNNTVSIAQCWSTTTFVRNESSAPTNTTSLLGNCEMSSNILNPTYKEMCAEK